MLDDLSNKIKIAEDHTKEIEEINLNAEEKEKLKRFDVYHVIRMEKYIRNGGDPTFGNLDAYEQTAEEFEYHLSHMLNDYAPESRYYQRKEMYYFHPSYIEMEKLAYWEDRAKSNYCNGEHCVPDCPFYEENGRIEDEQVVKEFIDNTEILEIDDYKRELGEEFVNSVLKDWNL
ncbi:hypothetical protein NMY3_00553 [Candidatus Nitrosocosmicus oleophilus]|uniref:Uncharacterized protein n=2 Tax=Candidatus Nitrosocosmicus oleophilus TaxID=1353260 RepID=A0A654LU97_9ARCH|nr:hypothetical protein NMY3_00553 [Candidatus Nitrosocosmicus oleophilus]